MALKTIEDIEKAIDEGNIPDAIKALEILLETLEEDKNLQKYGHVNYFMGMAQARTGNLRLSVQYFLKSLESYTKIKNETGIAKSLLGLGKVHRWRSDFAMAEEYLESFVKRSKEIVDLALIGQGYLELGIVKAERGDIEKAVHNFNSAINALASTDNDYQLSRAYQSLGEVLKRDNQYEKALYFLVKCIDLSKKAGLNRNYAYASTSAGECLLKSGNIDKAESHVSAGIKMFESTGDTIGLSDALRVQGSIKKVKGDLLEAYNHLNESLNLIKDKDIPSNEILIRIELVEVFLLLGKKSEIGHHLSKASKLAKRIENPDLIKKIEELTEKSNR